MEYCSLPENLPSDLRKAIEELVKGREIAVRLKHLIDRSVVDNGSEAAEDLATGIFNSFVNSLAILNRVDSDEVSQFPTKGQVGSPSWDGRKSEDSGESTKSSTAKDRRGCYKRRKNSQPLISYSHNLTDDGHAWRKYGQKAILNAKFPRNYYRCTHKYDLKCEATKQVQRVEEDPPMYRTTYYGHHTCNHNINLLLNTSHDQLNLIDPPHHHHDSDSSFLINFTTSNPNTIKQEGNPIVPSIKQEPNNKNEMPSTTTTTGGPPDRYHHHATHNNQSSSSDYLVSPPRLDGHGDGMISRVNSSSCSTTTTHSFDDQDISIMVGSVDFDDDVLNYF